MHVEDNASILHDDSLKQDIISRVPQVTKRDSLGRVNSFIQALTLEGGVYDVASSGKDHGVGLGGLDLPEKVKLMSLYNEPNVSKTDGLHVVSFTLGLGRISGQDPSEGEVPNWWCFPEYPESRRPGILETNDVTCWGKMHLAFPSNKMRELRESNEWIKGTTPFLVVNPVQTTPIWDGWRDAREELGEMLESADGDEARDLRRRMGLIKRGASIFRHEDRYLAFALIGLDAARSLGVKDVAYPSQELLARHADFPGPVLNDREAYQRLSDTRIPARYDSLEKISRMPATVDIHRLYPVSR